MAVPNEKVKAIQRLTIDIGELIVGLNPMGNKEWDAFNKLVDAHKNLMKIDTDSLLQLELPMREAQMGQPHPKLDCPRCGGEGKYLEPTDSTATPRQCSCKDILDELWPDIKADWKKLLQPAEV